MDQKRSKHADSSFPAKENPHMEKLLLDWPIVLQDDVKAKYRLISRKFLCANVFSPERSLNQPKATRVCIRSINQIICSIFVRLLFLFCSRVLISRSYENRSSEGNEREECKGDTRTCPVRALYTVANSSKDVFKRRTSTRRGPFSRMGSGLAHIFGQIVSMRVKTISNTNLVASSHIIRKFMTYIFGEYFLVWMYIIKEKVSLDSLLVDVRRLKTPLLKGAVSRQSSSLCLISPITRPQSLWNLK